MNTAYENLYASFAARAVDPASFQLARPGRPFPNPQTCLKIQCGSITQAEAGLDLLADCSFAGFAGAMSCEQPLCAPYCGGTAAGVARAAQPLPVAPRVEQMFLDAPLRSGCDPVYWGPKFGGPYSDSAPCGGCSSFINEHPFVSLALLAAGAYGIYRWRKGR